MSNFNLYFILLIMMISHGACVENQTKTSSSASKSNDVDTTIIREPVGDLLYQDYNTDPKTAYQKEVNAIIDYIADKGWSTFKSSSGLYYVIHHLGEGPFIRRGDQVRAHYTGEFLDGQVFDSSRSRNKPIWFTVGQMVAGWDEGMSYINAGSKATFIVPAHLAYAEEGLPGFVPPNSTLIFNIEVLQ